MTDAERSNGAEHGWEALFWTVFRRSKSPILLLDERRAILELNDPAAELIGEVREALLGSELAERFPPAEQDSATRDWHELLRVGDRLGTRGIVRPDGSTVEVEWAGRRVDVRGRRVVILVWVHDNLLPRRPRIADSAAPLTRREREVTTLIALGYDTRSIAESLYISPETVKSHVRKAMSKLGAHTRAQLVAIAMCSGQIAYVPHMGELVAPAG
jgi:PAS domain S-box-containing protein